MPEDGKTPTCWVYNVYVTTEVIKAANTRGVTFCIRPPKRSSKWDRLLNSEDSLLPLGSLITAILTLIVTVLAALVS